MPIAPSHNASQPFNDGPFNVYSYGDNSIFDNDACSSPSATVPRG